MGPLQRCLNAQNTVWVSVFRVFQNFFDGQSASVDARGAWRSNHHAICFFFCLFWKISKKFSVKLTIYYNKLCRILAVICFSDMEPKFYSFYPCRLNLKTEHCLHSFTASKIYCFDHICLKMMLFDQFESFKLPQPGVNLKNWSFSRWC